MPTITYCKENSKEYSRDGMDVDSVVESTEEIEFEITFKQMAQYFAPADFRSWSQEKKDGFVEAIEWIYHMDLLDDVIQEEDFCTWAYQTFYKKD
jgi:hypothetical protein